MRGLLDFQKKTIKDFNTWIIDTHLKCCQIYPRQVQIIDLPCIATMTFLIWTKESLLFTTDIIRESIYRDFNVSC
jgi:hypothetical protein